MNNGNPTTTDFARVISHIKNELTRMKDELRAADPGDPVDMAVEHRQLFPQLGNERKIDLSSPIDCAELFFGRPGEDKCLRGLSISCPGGRAASCTWKLADGDTGAFEIEATQENLERITAKLRDLAKRALVR
jgi:hypothetical protein